MRTITPGLTVTTLRDGIDSADGNEERTTPAGSVGWVEALNHTQADGVSVWHVHFPSGAAWNIDDNELNDPAQWSIADPQGVRALALYIAHGYEKRELTMFDPGMVEAAEALTSSTAELLRLIDKPRDLLATAIDYLREIRSGSLNGHEPQIGRLLERADKFLATR